MSAYNLTILSKALIKSMLHFIRELIALETSAAISFTALNMSPLSTSIYWYILVFNFSTDVIWIVGIHFLPVAVVMQVSEDWLI